MFEVFLWNEDLYGFLTFHWWIISLLLLHLLCLCLLIIVCCPVLSLVPLGACSIQFALANVAACHRYRVEGKFLSWIALLFRVGSCELALEYILVLRQLGRRGGLILLLAILRTCHKIHHQGFIDVGLPTYKGKRLFREILRLPKVYPCLFLVVKGVLLLFAEFFLYSYPCILKRLLSTFTILPQILNTKEPY
jgi:hypothetical protein